MANAKTTHAAISGGYQGCGGSLKVTPVTVVFDTTGADFEVYDPADNARWALVGLIYQEATAHNLIIKSGSTTLVTLERPASSQIIHPVGAGVLAVGLANGDALNLQCSAAISSLLVFIQEIKRLNFNR